MVYSKLEWEDLIQFEEIEGYGQQIWRHQGQYYFVTEEGGVASQRVVYELPKEFFELIEKGERSLSDVHFKLSENRWPPTEEEKRNTQKQLLIKHPISLIDFPEDREYFTQEELQQLIPLAEQQWIDWKGKLPDDYISPPKVK